MTELRAGHFDGSTFFDHPGNSLINDRAIDASIQERVLAGNEVHTSRASLNVLGDGFVEAIADSTLITISRNQPTDMRGQVVSVPVLEAAGVFRVGRFGWKSQQASLVSISADAYLNEMGITSPLQPAENTSNGNSVSAFDTVVDPDDDGGGRLEVRSVHALDPGALARFPGHHEQVDLLGEAQHGEAE